MTSAQRHNNAEVWIAFGTGKCFRFIPAHEIARTLGPYRCIACQCSTLLQVAIGCGFLEEEAKELYGTHGKPTMALHQHFALWRAPQSL